ncbi:tetratricopeptide repeat protein [Sphingomonas morindae]|uniref:Tetratricopeptide repeat protein n=1 Tax=Sphingomonas morindae TaxID=1541170 RepID=A0ABY4X657_9SPHN|nr:tetratricopeptide repeat protein [Sphingomonas morindae]USI72361.1 tetratricopeptide repeat protein [Sphingomonas morindae]
MHALIYRIKRLFGARRRRRQATMMAQADSARDRGDLLEAASLYDSVARAYPTDVGAWGQLGNMSKDVGDFARARAAYLKALALAPQSSDLHLQLGHLAKLTGERNEAIRCYRKALELDPSNAGARLELGLVSQAEISEADGAPDVAFAASLVFHRLTMFMSRRPS